MDKWLKDYGKMVKEQNGYKKMEVKSLQQIYEKFIKFYYLDYLNKKTKFIINY